MTVIDLKDYRAGELPQPHTTPAPAGESPPPDSPATIAVEQLLHGIRSGVDQLYSLAATDPVFMEALKDNRGFIGPIIRQLNECDRLTRKGS